MEEKPRPRLGGHTSAVNMRVVKVRGWWLLFRGAGWDQPGLDVNQGLRALEGPSCLVSTQPRLGAVCVCSAEDRKVADVALSPPPGEEPACPHPLAVVTAPASDESRPSAPRPPPHVPTLHNADRICTSLQLLFKKNRCPNQELEPDLTGAINKGPQ